MGIKGENNRQLIVQAADNLFYRRGYNQTSFQDISDATGIPRGNFYYYFKTKEDILNAVVDARVDNMLSMLTELDDEVENPRERLLRFSNMLDYNSEDVLRSGCPLGTLSSELAKDEPALQEKSRKVFVVLLDWLNKQFSAAGASNPDELAMDMIAKMQGVTVMACAFKDKDYIARSHQELKDWIDNQVKH